VLPALLIGYDGRTFSPEVFSGVSEAIRELGVSILDAGRCTAASLQESLRCSPEAAGALLITGAGFPVGWSGLDAYDHDGESVQVIWREYGVSLYADAASPVGGAAMETGSHNPGGSGLRLRLELPAVDEHFPGIRRLARRSGRHILAGHEDRYREWLGSWYRSGSGPRLLVATDDLLLRERVQWLAESAGASLSWCSISDAGRSGSGLILEVQEDDRRFELRRIGGASVTAERLASILNSSGGHRFSQLTAHADPVSNRLWLTDAARPGGIGMTERIEDALVTAGLLLSRGLHAALD
jgi:hypothetical protein